LPPVTADQVGTGHDRRPPQSQPGGEHPGGLRVVAADQDQLHVGVAKRLHDRGHLAAQRVGHGDEARQPQPTFGVGVVDGGADQAVRDGENAVALSRQVGRNPPGRTDPFVVHQPQRAEERLRGAQADDQPPLGVDRGVDRGRPGTSRVERAAGLPGVGRPHRPRHDASPSRQGNERRGHRVPDRAPLAGGVRRRLELRVGAQHHIAQQCHHVQG
jgi:hypothetical protein